MEDRTFLTNNHPTDGISDTFREYIAALVEEVVINGEPCDAQKKWLRKNSEGEGVDYATLEKNLAEFFEVVEESKTLHTKSSLLAAKLLARDCFLSENALKKLMEGTSSSPIPIPLATEFVDPQFLIRDGKLAEVEKDGRLIIPCGWKSAMGFHEGLACVETDDGLRGYIDTTGNIAIPCIWKIAESFSEGLALVAKQGEYYFINKAGDPVITFGPDLNPNVRCGGFHEGLAVVRDEQSNKFGFIDKSGHIAIPCTWYDASWFEDGLASVENNQGKQGCIDKNGRVVISCKYDEELCFSEGLATIYNEWENGGSFLIDKTGQKVCNIGFGCGIITFKEGLGSIEDYGFIDKTGKLIIEDKWSPEWMGFTEGLAPTEDGFIDHSGQVVIPADWECCDEFNGGLAWVSKGEKYGFIDHGGRLVIPYLWDNAAAFSDGLARVKMNDRNYFINKQGKVLCNCKKQH